MGKDNWDFFNSQLSTLLTNKTTNPNRFTRWLPVLVGLALWLWFCWPMMSGQTVVGFRDSAYLYYPLFAWIDAQWEAGEFPLWNPYCNFGMPIVGDATPSLLYPGKLVFFCRFLSFPSRYGIYLALHLLIAGVGTYWLARVLKANPAGATLAAISFAFGGCIVFQVTNVIYLVSAAWLPLALGCVWRMTTTGNFKWAVAAGSVCALMILGGDPQMVYHVGLIAFASLASQVLKQRNRSARCLSVSSKTTRGRGVHALSLIGVMVLTTVVLSLVQLWPSYEWSRLSERTQSKAAANLYQVVGQSKFDADSFRIAQQALLGPPQRGTVADHAYQFSLPPWSLIELCWPNSTGKIFPTHQRWADALPGADRIWFPSLYMGVLTVLLAVGGTRLFDHRRYVWLTRIGLFFGIASFGWYGIVWFINEILPPEQRLTGLGPQVGGIYWLMNILLPEYFSFRYPAKLFIVASLCLCLLAGIRLRSWRLNFVDPHFRWLAGLTAFGFVFVLIGMQDDFFSRVPADGLFGPFDAAGATRGLLLGLVQTGLVLAVAIGIRRRIYADRTQMDLGGERTNKRTQWAIWVIVIVTAFDLAAANRWLLAEVPVSTMVNRLASDDLLKATAELEKIQLPTIYRPRGAAFLPNEWSKTKSIARLAEIVDWQRETLYPKQHLGRDVRLVGSFTSIWPEQYERILDQVERRALLETERNANPLELSEVADWKSMFCDAELVDGGDDSERRTNLNWFESRPRLVFLANGRFHPQLNGNLTSWERAAELKPISATCEISQFSSNSITVHVASEQDCWLVHNSIFDGNWMARIQNDISGKVSSVPLVELVDCLQGVRLAAGEYDITISYQPTGFWLSTWVSGVGWILLFLGSFFFVVKRR